MSGHFADRLTAAVLRCRTAAVVGLDPVYESLPVEFRRDDADTQQAAADIERFGRTVIEAVAPHVPAIKINSGFFEAWYEAGVAAYFRLIEFAHAHGLLVIGDIKRGDIGSTARLYARGHLAQPTLADIDPARIPDAVTLAGYLGRGAVEPFVEAAAATGRGVFILVRPSDPGADVVHDFGQGQRFYEFMGEWVSRLGQRRELMGECGLSCVGAVVAAKDPASTAALRAAMPTAPWLVPGYGAQGGTAEQCRACFFPGGRGAVVNASRSVIYAYQDARWQRRCGDDWRACISEACREFAADIGRLSAVAGA